MSNPPAPSADSAKRQDHVAQASGSPNRSALAGRELLRALRDDLGAFGGWAKKRLTPASDRPVRPGPGGLGSIIRRIAKGALVLAVLGALVMTGIVLWALHELPFDSAIVNVSEREILLEAADGQALGRVGPLKISTASREEFPEQLVAAVLSIEDRRFYDHWGIDIVGVLRAASRNYSSGEIVQGGSTITQQLAKMRIVGSERTMARKLREALAAVWLEAHLSKDAILTHYLNSVYMGAGAQGLPAAAKLYFNKTLAELSLPESALLAGLIKAPSRFNPLQDFEGARQRAAVVLDAMVDNEAIDRQAAENAKSASITLTYPALHAQNAPWFSDWVAQEAQDVAGAFSGTIRMRTTLVPQLQERAERVLADALTRSSDGNVSQGALVAMRPDGAVVAMVGGRDYEKSQFNRAVQARRQAGSVFKLFVYLAALRNGYTPHDAIDASPLKIGGWEPENFGGREFGSLTLADAFAHSVNTAAVRLAADVGMDKVIAAARDLGIKAPLPNVPSLALGSADVGLLELTAAYAGILAKRTPIQPWGVTSFTPPGARTMTVGAPAAPQRSLGTAADQMVALLTLPVLRGTARKAALDGFAAGKTGTTQNHRDAWFVGFNERLVVGVWVGNDDGAPMNGVTGGSLPASIWKNFMQGSDRPLVSAGQPADRNKEPRQLRTGDGPPIDVASPDQEYFRCDVRACAARYQSFRAADCTYQPYGGGARERCGRLSSSVRQTSEVADAFTDGSKQAQMCNYDLCASAYSSFRASDCTYQPYDGGPRRMCQK